MRLFWADSPSHRAASRFVITRGFESAEISLHQYSFVFFSNSVKVGRSGSTMVWVLSPFYATIRTLHWFRRSYFLSKLMFLSLSLIIIIFYFREGVTSHQGYCGCCCSCCCSFGRCCFCGWMLLLLLWLFCGCCSC